MQNRNGNDDLTATSGGVIVAEMIRMTMEITIFSQAFRVTKPIFVRINIIIGNSK